MQNVLYPGTGAFTISQTHNITFNKTKPCPLRLSHQRLYFIQIVLVPGRKVIETDNGLIEFQQLLQQVGADEAG